jgi:hypothetical protein
VNDDDNNNNNNNNNNSYPFIKVLDNSKKAVKGATPEKIQIKQK